MTDSSLSRVWVDVSTIYASHGNLTGITRTVAFVVRVFLEENYPFRFCKYDEISRRFIIVSKDELLRWFVENGLEIPSELEEKSKSRGEIAVFKSGDILVELGANWNFKHYIETIYLIKKKSGINYISMVYDLIPCLMPHTFGPGFGSYFYKWFGNTLHCADLLMSISENTTADILNFCTDNNITPPPVSQIRLGDESFRSSSASDVAGNKSSRSSVLMVSTIENRKNHRLLYNLWRELIVENGKDFVPDLLLIGRQGWGTNDLVKSIKDDMIVAESIQILNEINDLELEALYDQCLFTIFPSLYEGWGLPVAESLARGKCCLASSASSLPEIVENLLPVLHPHDFISWKKNVMHLIEDNKFRGETEEEIKRQYAITTWRQTSQSIVTAIKNYISNR